MTELSETAACLRLLGDRLDPAEITQLLDKEPSSAYQKGDELSLRNGKGTRIAPTDAWQIDTGRKTPGDLDAQIAEILDGTIGDLSIWLDLSTRFRVEIFCGLFLREFNEGLGISPSTSLLLGERGIDLDLDIYTVADDWFSVPLFQ